MTDCIKSQCKLMANPRTNPGLLPPSQLEFLSKGICLSIRKWLLPVGSHWVKEMQQAASRDPPHRRLFHEPLYLTPNPKHNNQISGLKNACTTQAGGRGIQNLAPSSSSPPDPWSLNLGKATLYREGAAHDSCKQVIPENIEMAGIFSRWNLPISLCIWVLGTFMMKI